MAKTKKNSQSIVDFLSSSGKDTSFSSRESLFKSRFKGEKYTGTASQNAKLLDSLRDRTDNNSIQPISFFPKYEIDKSKSKKSKTRIDKATEATDPITRLKNSASKKTFTSGKTLEDINVPIGSDTLSSIGDTLKKQAEASTSGNPIRDSSAIPSQLKKLSKEERKVKEEELKQLGYKGKNLEDLVKQKFERDSIVYQGNRVDASKANFIRGVLPVPRNAAQMFSKRFLNEARMDENSLDDNEKLVLYNTIQNAMKRTGKKKGGTEYEDYASEYGTAEDFNNWFNRGKVDAIDLVANSTTNTGFKVASTVGRGKYFEDPETGDVIYTDVYDWNSREKNFKGEGIYQNLRNNMRASEDKNLNRDKNEKFRMNFTLKKDEMDKLRGVSTWENGGEIPKGYKPLSQQQRTDWNSFVKYLNRDLKVGGNKSLDDRTNQTGLNYLNDFRKQNPNFSITPEMVPYVQYEFQQLKNTNSLPQVNPQGRVKTLVQDYFKDREVSPVDGWIGSLTSRQGFPEIQAFSDDPTKKVWGLDYEGASKFEEDIWNKRKKAGLPPLKPMKTGGLNRSEDYGSKEKPYPSVSKGDFAGEGRSYPIPTKVDAIDALRLAGLHGRSDVKAKVYRKYPELKRGKYGLKVLQEGGIPDPTDPEFAIKMQELLRTNPELAGDIFVPVTSQTPPGVDGSQQLTGLQPSTAQSMAWTTPKAPNVNVTPDKNIDSQQKNNSWKDKKVNLPVGDAVMGLVMGANMLANEYIDEPRKRANEAKLLRKQLQGVISKPSQGGYDMPVLAKDGIQITSAYEGINNTPITKPRNPWGNTADQYKTDDIGVANVIVEDGEFLELPDGQTSTITGDSHEDSSGGEMMRLPEESKVYSDSIKVDKDFAKDLTGSTIKRKKTVAQLAKKYDTDHEVGILKDPTSDMISKRSANIMQTFKQGQLQQLFDYQESVKDPMYLLNKDASAEDFIGSEDTVVARNGVKVMQDGGKPKKKLNPLAPNGPMPTIEIVNGIPTKTYNVAGRNKPVIQRAAGVGFDTRTGNINTGFRPKLTSPTSTPNVTTPTSTPNLVPPTSTPDWIPQDLEPIRGKYILDTVPQGVTPPQLQPLKTPTTIQPGDTPIDPNKPDKPIPDNNKANPPQPSPKVPWGDTLGGFGEITPELFAMIQNQSDFPIFTAKYQPKYLNPVEMNIQASLNRNYAQTKPLLESTGNPSIDNARSAQAVANLYDANNEVFQQKFNFDTQNRYQTDAANLQTENQANLLNLQRADQFMDKVTARQAVKEQTNNNIVNSAYAKFKKKQLEQRSLKLVGQTFENFKYDPSTGIYFDPATQQQMVFHEPSGSFVNIGNSLGDNIETTRTTRTDNKGKSVQTIRQKEKKGS